MHRELTTAPRMGLLTTSIHRPPAPREGLRSQPQDLNLGASHPAPDFAACSSAKTPVISCRTRLGLAWIPPAAGASTRGRWKGAGEADAGPDWRDTVGHLTAVPGPSSSCKAADIPPLLSRGRQYRWRQMQVPASPRSRAAPPSPGHSTSSHP